MTRSKKKFLVISCEFTSKLLRSTNLKASTKCPFNFITNVFTYQNNQVTFLRKRSATRKLVTFTDCREIFTSQLKAKV